MKVQHSVEVHTNGEGLTLQGWIADSSGGSEYRMVDSVMGEVLVSFRHIIQRGFARIDGRITHVERFINGKWEAEKSIEQRLEGLERHVAQLIAGK